MHLVPYTLHLMQRAAVRFDTSNRRIAGDKALPHTLNPAPFYPLLYLAPHRVQDAGLFLQLVMTPDWRSLNWGLVVKSPVSARAFYRQDLAMPIPSVESLLLGTYLNGRKLARLANAINRKLTVPQQKAVP